VTISYTVNDVLGVDQVTVIGRVAISPVVTTGAVLSTTTTHCNALGQVDWRLDAAGERTDYSYDALGRQETVTQPETSIVNPLTGLAERVRAVTSYSYGGLGRQARVTGPLKRTLRRSSPATRNSQLGNGHSAFPFLPDRRRPRQGGA
jgi:YD repeat-containing protein